LAQKEGVTLKPELGIWNGATGNELNEIAWPLVDPDRSERDTDLVLGLALARAAVDGAPEEASYYDTLAWALFANGLYEEAIQASKDALRLAAEDDKADYQQYLERLRQMIEAAK
jgi:tetratricopeptide (TPR) repeat protein